MNDDTEQRRMSSLQYVTLMLTMGMLHLGGLLFDMPVVAIIGATSVLMLIVYRERTKYSLQQGTEHGEGVSKQE